MKNKYDIVPPPRGKHLPGNLNIADLMLHAFFHIGIIPVDLHLELASMVFDLIRIFGNDVLFIVLRMIWIIVPKPIPAL